MKFDTKHSDKQMTKNILPADDDEIVIRPNKAILHDPTEEGGARELEFETLIVATPVLTSKRNDRKSISASQLEDLGEFMERLSLGKDTDGSDEGEPIPSSKSGSTTRCHKEVQSLLEEETMDPAKGSYSVEWFNKKKNQFFSLRRSSRIHCNC